MRGNTTTIQKEIRERCDERQRYDERQMHRQTGGSGIARGDTTNSWGGQEVSAPEKKRGTTRGGGATRGGQLEAPPDRRQRRTRGNTTTSWGRQES